MITRNFNLFLNAGKHIPLVINVNQYDHDEQWCFTLLNDNGEKYIPSTGAIVGIKADRLGIINSGTVNASGQVVINETEQMTAAVGKAIFELVIDDGTHGTANFVVLVEPKPGDNADLSETDISMIEEAIEAASSIKPYGSPLVASTVAGMTDHEKVYVYVGSETGYTSGNWYYWDGSAWTSGGVYNSVAVQTDTTLTLSGVAADAKKTGDEISDLKSQISTLSAIPHEVKLAMDTLFHKMAIINTESESYANEYATIHAWATAVNLVSISAVYTQIGYVLEGDDLDNLKEGLVVTASFDDGTEVEVDSYTLSGTLEDGTSIVTVTYEGKTDTFTVAVGVDWTLEWNPSDGVLPHETSDWTRVGEIASGYGSVTFDAVNGAKLVWRRGGYGASPTNYQTTTNGIMEITANFATVITAIEARATLSTTSCIIGFLTGAGVRINGGAYTPIPDTVPLANTDYVIRTERIGSVGKVYVNGKLMYSGELRDLSGTNNAMISINGTPSSNCTAYIKAIRFYHES